jgi:hypothetical protein
MLLDEHDDSLDFPPDRAPLLEDEIQCLLEEEDIRTLTRLPVRSQEPRDGSNCLPLLLQWNSPLALSSPTSSASRIPRSIPQHLPLLSIRICRPHSLHLIATMTRGYENAGADRRHLQSITLQLLFILMLTRD